MKQKLLRNAFTLKAFLLVSMIVGAVSGAWAEDFVKVTSTADLSSGGEYILVAESANMALSGFTTSGTIYGKGTAVTISDGTISTDAALVFVLGGGKTNGWSFYSSSDIKYLSWSSGNSLRLDGTEYKWTIDFSGGNVAIVSVKDTSRKIRWNSGSPRFACYTTEQTDIQLYKKASNPLPDPELSFSTDVVNAVFGGDFELPTLNTASGFDGTVEYSSSDETVAQIMDPETGDLRILKGGTTTITATFAGNENFKSGSASYTLNVTDNRIATSISCDPIELDINDVGTLTMLRPVVLDAEGNVVEYTNSPDAEGLPEVYFETVSDEDGILGSFDSHGNIVLNSVEGTATIKAVYNQFQTNENYQPSECTFMITVTAPFTGGDVTFTSASFNSDTETSLTKKVVTITGSKLAASYYQAYKNSNFTVATSAGKITQIVFICTSSNPASGFATIDGFTTDGDNGTWVGRAESVTFTASNLQVRATEIVVTVDMRADAGLAFDESANVNATLGEAFTAPTLINPNKLSVTYASGNEDVATVDPATGAVTLVGAGDATITATFEGDDTYSEGSASYTIKVTAANQVATPVIAFGAETFFESTTATITCATEGATILYSTDNGENWQTYSEAITLTETTTIIAKATKEGATDSQICEAATATKNSVEADLATLAAKEAGTYYVNLNNVVVTYVNGNNAYMKDASGAILLYKSGHGFTAGQVINGIASVTLQIRNKNPQLTDLTGAEGYSVVDGTAPEPTTVTAADWNTPINTVLGQYLKVTGATITSESSKYYVQLGTEKVQLYGQGDARTISVEDLDATYTIVGFPTVYNTTPELQIFVQPEKEEAVDERAVVILSFEKESYEATVGQEFEEPTLSVKDESGAPIEGLTITYTYHSEVTPPAMINESGEVTIIEPGEIVFTAVFAGNDIYQPATASYTLIVKSQPKTNPELAFSENNCTVTIGADDNIFPTLNNPYDVEVKYTSSNTAVATVGGSTGDITLVGAGETTITASFEGSDEYEAGKTEYVLTVNEVLPEGLVVDALEYGLIPVTGTSYVDWSGVEGISGAVYAGNSAAGNNAVQLRTKNKNEGIVTTASSGMVNRLVVEWNSNTTAGRKLNIYGSNTAYTSAADLYDSEKQGTLIGTTEYDAAKLVATIYVQGNYQYIGIRSDDGALYLNKVSVGWLVKPIPSITLKQYEYNVNADGGDAELIVTCSNMPEDPQLKVKFVEADGETAATYGWITAVINEEGNIAGHMDANTGEARTAYFIVTGKDGDGNVVKSQRVTINQEAPVTEPTITVNTETWEFEYNGGAKTFGFEYANLGSEPTFSVQFFESDGTTETACGWITTQFEANDDKVTITPAVNDGTSARTAYFKIYAVVNEAKVYSNLVTISQKANSETPQPGSQYLWYLSEASYDSNASAEKVTWSSDFATMVVDKAGSTTPANNYLGGDNTSTRFYKNSTLTITRVVGYRIASVLFQATTEGYAKTFKNSTWTNVAEAAISGENSVVLTPTDGMEAIVATIGGTCGFDKVQVTYVKTEEVVKQSANLAFAETSFSVEPEADFTAPKLTTAEGFDGTIVYSSTDDDIALVDETTGEVLIGAKEGVVTITATSAETENFKAGSASYTITVKAPEKAEPEISFAEAIYTVNIGEEFTAPALINPHGLTVTYSCDNVEIALVDETTGDVVLDTRAKATVTISAYFAGDETYKPAIASYTIKIVDPTASTTIYCAFVTEYDGKVYAVNNTISSSTLGATEVTIINGKVLADDNIIWKVSEIETEEGSYTIQSKANDKYLGYNKTSFSLNDNPGSYTWTYDAAAGYYLNSDGSRSLIYGRDAAGFKNYATSNVTKEEYSAVAMPMATASGCTRTLSNTWGTVCFDHQVLVENTVNARFYWVAGKVLNEAGEPIKLMLREEDMSLKTGYPFIVEAIDPTAPVALLFEEGEVVENALNMDGLYGTFTGTSVPEGAYVLSGGNFVKCGTGCSVGPNRAYLNMEDVPVYYGDESGVKVFNLGGEDGISSLDAAAEGAVIYDLSGRRVSKTVKGLYIVNGKKVSVK